MTAILSGVALIYLYIIVISPSVKEFAMNFHREPIMCTTVQANDISAGGKKVNCPWYTCGEWCLSNTSSPCMQIFAMPRKAGHDVNLNDCKLLDETPKPCSALNISLTDKKLCKKGECKELSGVYNCTKENENECREITPAYDCFVGNRNLDNVNKTEIVCDEEKCSSRLMGVYLCREGTCGKVEDKITYEDCQRKCEDLDLTGANTILFGKDYLTIAKCSSANSTNETLSTLNKMDEWKDGQKYLFIFCSFATYETKNNVANITMKDCFNATLRKRESVRKITSFLKLIETRNNVPDTAEWLLDPEESLRIMNDTKLKINTGGCVNTLMKECKAFFETHATDGKDGKTPDRYSCFYTDTTSKFVIGKFEPEVTYLYLLLASIIPATLFVVSCFCLFFCSKSVGVDESGQLKVTLLKGAATTGNASEL